MLIELMLDNQITIDVPNGYQPSYTTNNSNLSSKYLKSSSKSKSRKKSVEIVEDNVEEINQTIKQSLLGNVSNLPSSLRALMRGYENN